MSTHKKGPRVFLFGGKVNARRFEGELSPIEKMFWHAIEEEFPQVAEGCDKLIDGKLCMMTMEECSLESCPKIR